MSILNESVIVQERNTAMARSGSARKVDNRLNKLLSADLNESSKIQVQKPAKPALGLDFSNDSLLNAVVMAEVLGKPKCLKGGRR